MSSLFSRLSAKLITFLHLNTYYGKTKHHFKVRMFERLETSALTGKIVNGDDDSDIKEHLLFYNHWPEDFSILTTSNSDLKVTVMESLLINKDHHIEQEQAIFTFGTF